MAPVPFHCYIMGLFFECAKDLTPKFYMHNIRHQGFLLNTKIYKIRCLYCVIFPLAILP